jgi:excisionase family DNA binding protein
MAEKAEKEFLSFEEALRELRLKEEELKRLVSEGEIRAFRDGETMKLRKKDVESLRTELSGGEVVDLGQPSEELVFEDDTDLDAGMATEEISEADTLLEEQVEEVAEVELEREERPAARSRRAAAMPVARSSTTVVETEEPATVGAAWVAALIVSTLLLLLAVPVCLSASSGTVTDIAKAIAGIFTTV